MLSFSASLPPSFLYLTYFKTCWFNSKNTLASGWYNAFHNLAYYVFQKNPSSSSSQYVLYWCFLLPKQNFLIHYWFIYTGYSSWKANFTISTLPSKTHPTGLNLNGASVKRKNIPLVTVWWFFTVISKKAGIISVMSLIYIYFFHLSYIKE